MLCSEIAKNNNQSRRALSLCWQTLYKIWSLSLLCGIFSIKLEVSLAIFQTNESIYHILEFPFASTYYTSSSNWFNSSKHITQCYFEIYFYISSGNFLCGYKWTQFTCMVFIFCAQSHLKFKQTTTHVIAYAAFKPQKHRTH